jgi:hypothetical protein
LPSWGFVSRPSSHRSRRSAVKNSHFSHIIAALG